MTGALRYIFVGVACTALFAFPFYTNADTLSKPPNNLGLVGYWSFNDRTATIAGDFSGNGNHGTLRGSTAWANGTRGSALSFDGDDDVDVSGVADNIATGDFTVAAWVNFPNGFSSANGNNQTVFSLGEDTSDNDAYLIFDEGSGAFTLLTAPGETTSSARISWTRNTWYHVVAVCLNTCASKFVYVNGVQDGTSSAGRSNSSLTDEAFIGSSQGTSEGFEGLIDEVRIYNRALGATEVAALARAGAVKALASSADLDAGSSLESGLVGHWTFDGKDTNWVSDTVGTTTDRSGSGNNGGILNMNRRTSVDGGVLGQSLVFDGITDDRVNFGDVTFLDGLTQATFCTWLKYTPASVTDGSLISKYSTAGHSFLFWADDANSGSISFFAGLDSSGRVTGTTDLVTSGVWDHYCVTFQGGTALRLYKNGVFNAQQTTNVSASIPNTSTSMLLGDDGNLNRKLNGLMDEVRIYNRILTDGELKQLYQLGQVKIRQ